MTASKPITAPPFVYSFPHSSRPAGSIHPAQKPQILVPLPNEPIFAPPRTIAVDRQGSKPHVLETVSEPNVPLAKATDPRMTF